MCLSDNFTIPEPECTDPLQKPQDPCNPNYCRLHVCNNVRECIPSENCCECGEGKYYNGTHCVLEENCPCLDEDGLTRYPGLIIISPHIIYVSEVILCISDRQSAQVQLFALETNLPHREVMTHRSLSDTSLAEIIMF